MIVAIEGIDASGKATHSKLLAERLGGTRFTFPDYETSAGKAILAHLKRQWQCVGDLMEEDKDGTWDERIDGVPLDAMVFQALQTVNRLELLPQIAVAHARGPVVFDRYYASALVYGGLDGLDVKWIQLIQAPLPEPDVWVLIDVSPEEGVRRRPERRDRYEKQADLMEKVRASYLRLFEERRAARNAWRVVDGHGTIEEVQARIAGAIGIEPARAHEETETINGIKPETWRGWTKARRNLFDSYWRKRGIASFVCLGCGFPVAYGCSACDACRPVRP